MTDLKILARDLAADYVKLPVNFGEDTREMQLAAFDGFEAGFEAGVKAGLALAEGGAS
ncbi:hypothetical protein GCM10010915_12140 [Microbacterium faecale]|uniref:Uncharacterized protein n=1 Tax=Microbacterium faecale TaxID=1804630 RepID=A0A917DG91_9MICO|nr:hypothetical protein [Microbacterium faecale]GGD33330.1 hypothetical protein GCM10010915_12140 [Microbacterium faecale]